MGDLSGVTANFTTAQLVPPYIYVRADGVFPPTGLVKVEVGGDKSGKIY